jgi:hypothetical protein
MPGGLGEDDDDGGEYGDEGLDGEDDDGLGALANYNLDPTVI